MSTVLLPTAMADGSVCRRVGVPAGNLNLERVVRIVLERTGLGDGVDELVVAPELVKPAG